MRTSDVTKSGVEHAELEKGYREERIDSHGFEEPTLALTALAEVQVDLRDVEVDVRHMDLWGEHTELVVDRERKVEVVVVEVYFGQGLDVDLRTVWFGGCFVGLGSDRLDHPVVGSGAVERHGDEVDLEGDLDEQRKGLMSASADSMAR